MVYSDERVYLIAQAKLGSQLVSSVDFQIQANKIARTLVHQNIANLGRDYG